MVLDIGKSVLAMDGIKFIVLLLLFPSFCWAGDWSKEDSYWQSAYTVAMILDCAQARDQRPGYIERNPILGEHPSKGRIDNLCLASGIGHFAISYNLPPDWRRIWQISTAAVEVVIIEHQYKIGLKFSF